MELEDILNKVFSHGAGNVRLAQGNEVCILGQLVYHHQDNIFSWKKGKPSIKPLLRFVQNLVWYWEWMKEVY